MGSNTRPRCPECERASLSAGAQRVGARQRGPDLIEVGKDVGQLRTLDHAEVVAESVARRSGWVGPSAREVVAQTSGSCWPIGRAGD
jgi:hypothetical protein